jgi:aminopeptidase YwaD
MYEDLIREERLLKHVEYLSEYVGPRIYGTETERKASEYIASVLEEYGLDTAVERFTIPSYITKGAKLKIVESEQGIDCVPLTYSASTPFGGLERPLVCVGDGSEAEYEGKDVSDKIVLVRQPAKDRIHTYKKIVATAAALGSAGAIIYSREGPPCNYSLAPGELPLIPTVSISSTEGQNILLKLLEIGEVKVHLTINVEENGLESCNVIGTLQGNAQKEDMVVLCAHIDSVIGSPGANDNGTGVAAVLEIAQASIKVQLEKTMKFLFFGAEEPHPYCLGSRYYVKKHKSDMAKIKAVLNLDEIGVGTRIDNRFCLKTHYYSRLYDGEDTKTEKWLSDLILSIGRKLQYKVYEIETPGISDNVPFSWEGVPAVLFRWMDDALAHTPEDRSINVDSEKVKKVALVAANAAWEIANINLTLSPLSLYYP